MMYIFGDSFEHFKIHNVLVFRLYFCFRLFRFSVLHRIPLSAAKAQHTKFNELKRLDCLAKLRHCGLRNV